MSIRPIAALSVVLTCWLLTACSDRSAGDTTAAPARTAHVTITAAKGCAVDRPRLAAGAVTFRVTNVDATAVSEVELLDGAQIVGEKENLPPGLGGTFAVRLSAGRYTLQCPGARPQNVAITVTGTAEPADRSVSTLLTRGARTYAAYVRHQVGYLVAEVGRLDRKLRGTNLAAAQRAYLAARPFYEKIEPVAESFTVGPDSLDADIDARANDVPRAQWTGFHRIEQGLFQAKSLRGLSGPGERLLADVTKLQKRTGGLTYQPFELANGAQELLDEVAASKITGEEERYSHVDLLDIAANVEGARQAFAALQPGLARIDGRLSDTVATGFQQLAAAVTKYRTTANPSGYAYFAALTAADKQQLTAAVKAVQAPLSRVASKVATA